MTARAKETRGSRRLLGVAGVLVILGTACSSSPASDRSGAAAPAAPAASAAHKTPAGAPAASAPGGGSKDGSTGSNVAQGVLPSAVPSAAAGDSSSTTDPSPGPAPIDFPYKNKVPVTSVIDPPCPSPGDKVTLKVDTKPKAAIAYQAMYADGNAGTAPPFGKGYGGNDKGYSSDSGHFESSWVLAPNTPPGRARVDVIVGFSGKWGYDAPHFGVKNSEGQCPQAWIHDDGGHKK